MVVFRSATHIGSNVILTELKHGKKSFVVAIETNRKQGKININSIRSIHYRTSLNIIGWLNNGLADYIKPTFNTEWLEPIKKELLSQPQYNSTDVRKQLNSVAKVLQNFENPAIIEQKNEKNLKEHRLDHQRGYTSNNGKYFSINAEGAMIDGQFPKIEFCKVYGLKKKVFDFLVDLGIIYTDGEWHIFNTQSPTGKPVTVIFHNSTMKQLGEGARGADYAVAVECWRKVSEEEAKHIATYLNSIGYSNFKNYNDSQSEQLAKDIDKILHTDFSNSESGKENAENLHRATETEAIIEQEAEIRDALVDLLGEAIGKENVITDDEQAQALLDRVKSEEVEEQVEQINQQFNEELQQ